MKNIFFSFIVLLATGCSRNNDKPVAEIDKLPPATQKGANTIGCLINGQALLPKEAGIPYYCFYQELAEHTHC